MTILKQFIPNKLIKKAIKYLGFDIRRIHECPSHTLLGLRVLPINTILDIGANEGQFAGYIRYFFPNALIYSFEPLPGPFEKLARMASLQKHHIAVNLACGEQEGTHDFHIHTEHSPSSSFLETTNESLTVFPMTEKQNVVPVRSTTLDTWLNALKDIPPKDILVKLDVQGFEDRVIRGGSSVFANASACIVEICLDRLYSKQAEFSEVFKLLDSHGLKYVGNLNQVYATDGHVIYLDAVFVRN